MHLGQREHDGDDHGGNGLEAATETGDRWWLDQGIGAGGDAVTGDREQSGRRWLREGRLGDRPSRNFALVLADRTASSSAHPARWDQS